MMQRPLRTPYGYAVLLIIALVLGTHVLHAQSTNPLKLIKGVITDTRSGKPIDGGKLNVYASSSAETFAYSKINPKTGAFQLILAPATTYRFEVISPRFYTTDFTVQTPPGNGYEETVKNFNVEPLPIGTVAFTGRAFDAGSARLLTVPGLTSLAGLLKKQTGLIVSLIVIADLAPTAAKKPAAPKKPKKGAPATVTTPVPTAPATNPAQTLLDERIAALKTYFKGLGISTDRLEFDGQIAAAGRAKGDNVTIKLSKIRTDFDDD